MAISFSSKKQSTENHLKTCFQITFTGLVVTWCVLKNGFYMENWHHHSLYTSWSGWSQGAITWTSNIWEPCTSVLSDSWCPADSRRNHKNQEFEMGNSLSVSETPEALSGSVIPWAQGGFSKHSGDNRCGVADFAGLPFFSPFFSQLSEPKGGTAHDSYSVRRGQITARVQYWTRIDQITKFGRH